MIQNSDVGIAIPTSEPSKQRAKFCRLSIGPSNGLLAWTCSACVCSPVVSTKKNNLARGQTIRNTKKYTKHLHNQEITQEACGSQCKYLPTTTSRHPRHDIVRDVLDDNHLDRQR